MQHARAMFVCACVHDLLCLLEILSGAGVDLIYHYIFGDMSVIRTRRSAHVFVRTISAVVDYFLVLLGAFNPVWDNPVASRAAPAGRRDFVRPEPNPGALQIHCLAACALCVELEEKKSLCVIPRESDRDP